MYVTKEHYLQMLHDEFCPRVEAYMHKEDVADPLLCLHRRAELVMKHLIGTRLTHSARCHTGDLLVRVWLNEMLVVDGVRFPDLIPCNFFKCSFVISGVYMKIASKSVRKRFWRTTNTSSKRSKITGTISKYMNTNDLKIHGFF